MEINIIGEDFHSGYIANCEIDILLGNEASICGDRALRNNDGYTECPNYCDEVQITYAKLIEFNIRPALLPASHKFSKKRYKLNQDEALDANDKFVAIFVIGSEIYATRPLASKANALACALWYVLAYYT